jgi:epoxyqueuosine reductase
VQKITSELVKEMVRDLGADLVGIASVDRFEGAPPGHGPLELNPMAKSVVVAGIRIPDPVVDSEGYGEKMIDIPRDKVVPAIMNDFYMQMGHYAQDLLLNTLAVKLANKLEIGWGLRSLPTPNTFNTGLGRTVMASMIGFFSQRHAATRAGLGEFGFNGLVLTPQFGPRVRFVSVITEAELEPDPLLAEKVCMRGACGGKDGPLCFQRCTHGALQMREGVDIDKVFIDIPTRNELKKCIGVSEEAPGFGCGFVGGCLRVCPTGKKVTHV